MLDSDVPERTKLVATTRDPLPSLAKVRQTTGTLFDVTPLSTLIPELIGDPSFLGRRIREAVQELSRQTLLITFHLPLENLKVAPDAILLKHADFVYGSLHCQGDRPVAMVEYVAKTCCSTIATVEHHLISQYQALHPDLLSSPITGRERTVLTLWRSGKSRDMIAADLVISHNTVKTHLQRLHRKLGGEEFWQMVVQAENMGLFHYLQC
jgi:DNA-binding CsgD family transcriptional regulator